MSSLAGLLRFIDDELERRNMTQLSLAEKAGISSTTISNWRAQSSKRKPDLDTIKALAFALNVPMCRLLEAYGYPVDLPPESPAARTEAEALVRSSPRLAGLLAEASELPQEQYEQVLALVQSALNMHRTKH